MQINPLPIADFLKIGHIVSPGFVFDRIGHKFPSQDKPFGYQRIDKQMGVLHSSVSRIIEFQKHGPTPHFRAEAHTHSKLRAFLRKRFYPPPAAQLQRGTSPPLRNPQLSEGTREIISERSLIMKKDIKFSTRMASADREKIRALAAKAHMSMSDYVTACCLGKRIVVIDEQKELLRQFKGIGSNINRLTVLANMGKVQVIGLEKAAGELSEVSAALRSVMEGR